MIDVHSHLDLYPAAIRLLPEVARRNLFTLVVTTSPRAWEATRRVFAGYNNIEVALGLHPEVVERKANERELFIECIMQAKFLGEIGLDGCSAHRKTLAMQESFLDDVLTACERTHGRIMSLHSRGAVSRVLDLIGRHPLAGKPILHWFSGTIKELTRAIELDCWFSVGPAMLTNAKGRMLLRSMPPDRVLPESDGPFATRGGIPLMPWDSFDIVSELQKMWCKSSEEVSARLRENLESLKA